LSAGLWKPKKTSPQRLTGSLLTSFGIKTDQNKKYNPSLIQKETDGGLDVKDFSLWVKRLCFNSNAPWKFIPKSLVASVCGTDYDYKLFYFDVHLPEFNKQTIYFSQDVVTAVLKIKKNEILSQTIWNNRFITVNNKMIYFHRSRRNKTDGGPFGLKRRSLPPF